MAARPVWAEAQCPTHPPPFWPVLCSAVLVGMMIASEVRRAYHTPGTTADRPATGAFGIGPSADEPVAAQRKRAQEPGRGRHAQTPWQIPWRGWKDILWRTYEQIGENRLLAVAAGVVFYGLLAVFPAVTALVSLYGLFASPAAISDQLALLAGFLRSTCLPLWFSRWPYCSVPVDKINKVPIWSCRPSPTRLNAGCLLHANPSLPLFRHRPSAGAGHCERSFD